MSSVVAMSRRRTPGSWAMHTRARAWLVRKLHSAMSAYSSSTVLEKDCTFLWDLAYAGWQSRAARRSPTPRCSGRSKGSDMLMRSEPFREFDRLTEAMLTQPQARQIPVDAYRGGNEFTVHMDVPGVDSRFIELT